MKYQKVWEMNLPQSDILRWKYQFLGVYTIAESYDVIKIINHKEGEHVNNSTKKENSEKSCQGSERTKALIFRFGTTFIKATSPVFLSNQKFPDNFIQLSDIL